MTQAYVLLPEEEGVAVGVAGQALTAVVAADGTDTLDGLHELWRLTKPVEVEGKLCIFDGLSSRNCRRKDKEVQTNEIISSKFYFYNKPHDLVES